jgi:hypothetical protein
MTSMLDLMSRSATAIAHDASWKSVLALTGAAIISRVMGRASAAARHLVWCLALCGVLALPMVNLLAPGWAWPVLPARENSALASARASTSAPMPFGFGARDPNETRLGLVDAARATPDPRRTTRSATTPRRGESAPEPAARELALSLWPWLLGVWLAINPES